jgi:hypothetical protein
VKWIIIMSTFLPFRRDLTFPAPEELMAAEMWFGPDPCGCQVQAVPVCQWWFKASWRKLSSDVTELKEFTSMLRNVSADHGRKPTRRILGGRDSHGSLSRY